MKENSPKIKLGLALSGGGFRASLFHVGVLARLAELFTDYFYNPILKENRQALENNRIPLKILYNITLGQAVAASCCVPGILVPLGIKYLYKYKNPAAYGECRIPAENKESNIKVFLSLRLPEPFSYIIALASWIHLAVFDRLFLHYGKISDKPETPPAKSASRKEDD